MDEPESLGAIGLLRKLDNLTINCNLQRLDGQRGNGKVCKMKDNSGSGWNVIKLFGADFGLIAKQRRTYSKIMDGH